MKKALNIAIVLLVPLLISCGGKEEKKKAGFSYEKKAPTEQKAKKVESTVPASKKVDLENKGIGPISSISLPSEVDQTMATQGADVFKKMCTACHRTDKKFIGPSPKNILTRRSPEWVMNMILNPDEMVQKDPLAKALLIEFNGSPMANQNLSEEDARAVLEYFRTLK
ncbi:c-type cytochrome [Flavivirga algicola]|uniref:Cytochrome c n=1 Tax=Flavivirga algicola TaxID=2729136 RepID=A0ABX1RVA2_9FLAO|nr:cytochrome c [Flavivirga algicola]NMH87481.1 cytochrome c [Flavivirga algicola]